MDEYDGQAASGLTGRQVLAGIARTVRPTLVATVGGTGVAAAKEATASLRELLGLKPPFFAVRAFDTDVQDNAAPRLIDAAEFINLSDFNVRVLLDAISSREEYRHWHDWVPPRLSAQQVSGGVGGVRPKGRLCYCYGRARIKQAIQTALSAILQTVEARELHEKHGITVDSGSGIDVHIVSSICGGTGSGMFLDLAYDLRRWAQEVTEGLVQITGHLVLPGAFSRKPAVHKILMANAYAALQELDRFMRGDPRDPWRMRYTMAEDVVDTAPPFDVCYLLDGYGHGGLVPIEGLTAMIGEAIAQFAVGEPGARLKARVRNIIDSRLAVEDHRDRPCCYSSYGIVSLEIPKPLIVKTVGIELAKAIGEQLQRPSPDKESIVTYVTQCLDELRKRTSDINNHSIITKLKNFQLSFVQDVEPMIANIMYDAAYQKLKELEFAAEEDEVASLMQHVTDYVSALHNKTEQEIKEALPKVVSLHGILACRVFLEEIANQLDIMSVLLNSEKDKSIFTKEGGKSNKDARREYEDWQRSVHSRALVKFYEDSELGTKRLIGKIRSQFMPAWDAITQLSERLGPSLLQTEKSYYQHRQNRISVAPLEYFVRLIERDKKALVTKLLETMAGDLNKWSERGPRFLQEELERVCSDECFKHLAKQQRLDDCEELFTKSHEIPQDLFEERLTLISCHASPLWEIDEAYPLANNMLEVSCVGVIDTSRIFQALQQSNLQIECAEQQRGDYIPIFRTEHGISLVGLRRLKTYRAAFIQSISEEQRWDFQFFNNAHWITEMNFPDEEIKEQIPLQAFSICVMKNIIFRTDCLGYFWSNTPHANDASSKKEPLAKTRYDAFRKLSADQAWVNRMEEVLEAWSKDGKDGKAQLLGYIEDLKERITCALKMEKEGTLNLPGGSLKRDVFQIHNEIRALRELLEETEVGL